MPLARLSPSTMHRPAGQYSHATRVPTGGTLVFIAGQVGIDRAGQLADGFAAQVKQAWENLLNVLGEEGLNASDLVHVNSYLVDGVDIAQFRQIRAGYLPNPPPSSTALIVPRLISPDWLFEVDGVAFKEDGRVR